MREDASAARIDVDCGRILGPLRRVWASFGYDELNWTATPNGLRNLGTMRGFMETPYTVRVHNIFTSGSGRGLPHWSSGNVYHEDGKGNPHYDWSVIDPAFDAWVHNGCRPIVELGFCPRALVPEKADLAFKPMPSLYGPYESGLWAWPPRDLSRWHGLVAATVAHFRDRYGADEVRSWYWELWNEPDIFYWQGTPEEFFRLYDTTVSAVISVEPQALVGGPATTGAGDRFLDQFLAHCALGTNVVTGQRGTRLDFVSFHTKGASFHPWRSYGPIGPDGASSVERASPSTTKMLTEVRRSLAVIARYPEFRALPVLVDECDAAVPAHWGIYDNANFAFQNTAYYPVFQAQLMKKLLDMDRLDLARVHAATTWSWYLEGDRFFEGTRSLFTAGNLPTPLLNAYRLFARLPEQRLAVESNRSAGLSQLDGGEIVTEVDALAASGDANRVAVLVWHHGDDQYLEAPAAAVTLTLRNLPFAGKRVRVRHTRIDADHGNAHTAWVAMGRPQNPDPAQLASLHGRAALEPYAPDWMIEPVGPDLELSFELPLPGVSLLECEVI